MGLRIAVLSRNFATTGGGAERYSIAIVEQLAPRHDIHVFAQTIEHAFPGVTYHQVGMPLRRPRWINQLYFAAATWWATRKGFDIVHSHENTWHGNVQTVHVLPIKHTLFASKTGLAWVLRCLKVATSPRLLAYLWLEKMRYVLNGKKQIVLTSDSLQKVMLGPYPHAQAAMNVIAPGVASVPGRCSPDEQHAARTVLGLPQEGRGLLFVGNDFKKKGLPTLLDALTQLPVNAWLAVVGQSQQLDSMQQCVHTLGLAGRVHFLGALSNMDDAYRAADYLVHPTLEDTYAMVVLEAMAHGLPVVVSGPAYCGISADLKPDHHAVVIDEPTSTPALASGIIRILNDAAFAENLSQHATQFAIGHTWQTAAKSYEALYSAMAPVYRQRWLVLSHAFNMDGRAASQTITDKLPHLEKAGIELVVLSGVSGRRDAHFEHHQLWPAGPAGIRFELRHVLRKRLGSGPAYRVVMIALSLPLLPFMLLEKLLKPVESSWSWWLSAYCKGLWLARRRKFDLIYSTGGAFAAHIAGKHLKKSLGIAWMAEVHDPLLMPGSTPCTPQEKLQAEVERDICNHADLAFWFTQQALASARLRHPQLGTRGQMLLPGVDPPADILPPYVPGDKFIIGHFGSLSKTRNLSLILRVLESLGTTHSELFELIELHVYGGPLDVVSAQLLESSPAKACVHHFGRIETNPDTGMTGREQILRRMRAVDVLLLLHGEENICAEYIPSKLYEYFWMQRPIIATVHRNPQMNALLRAQGHLVINTDSIADSSESVDIQFSNALAHLLSQWQAVGLPDNHWRSPYTTEASVGQIVQWTNHLTAPSL